MLFNNAAIQMRFQKYYSQGIWQYKVTPSQPNRAKEKYLVIVLDNSLTQVILPIHLYCY